MRSSHRQLESNDDREAKTLDDTHQVSLRRKLCRVRIARLPGRYPGLTRGAGLVPQIS